MEATRILIWIYFFLLIFEGALRKWVLPGFATPLLLVRDPVLMAAYSLAVFRGIFPFNLWNSLLLLLAAASFGAALFFGHGNWRIALFGMRCLFFHLPLIFLMGKVFNLKDVLRIGRAYLLLVIPMTALLLLQFYSEADSWANTGLGGEGTSTFSGAEGFNRCSGTFSFGAGLTLFYTLAAAFYLISFSLKTGLSLVARVLVGACIILAMPLCISRSLVLSVFIVLLVSLVVYSRRAFSAQVLPRLVLALAVLSVIVFSTSASQDGLKAFLSRWDSANDAADGGVQTAVVGRITDGFTSVFDVVLDTPELGYGLGLGTTFGAFEYCGVRAFLLGEDEWQRIVREIGPFLGFFYISFRVIFCLILARLSWRALKDDNSAPMIIFSATFLQLINGQTGQATSLGFMVFNTGLCYAALKLPKGARLVEAEEKSPLPFHPDLPVPELGNAAQPS